MLVYLIIVLSNYVIGNDKIIMEMLKDIVKKIDIRKEENNEKKSLKK
jgi:hypothetical protein